MSRYNNFNKIKNDLSFYSKQLESRNRKNIVMYRPRTLGFLTEDFRKGLSIRYYTWSTGINLYKLALEFYGDQDLWWLIGMYNNKPIDALWEQGDIVEIPFPVEKILNRLNMS